VSEYGKVRLEAGRVQYSPITIIDESIKNELYSSETPEIIGLNLDIFGTPLKFHLSAAGTARLVDIVPAARTICNKVTDIIIEQTQLGGSCIPCDKGCHACCNYLVSLSAPEVFRFRQEVFPRAKYLPDTMLRTYLLAARRLIKHRLPEQVTSRLSSETSKNPDDLTSLSSWYASLNLTCPFLYSRQCAIYHQRPLVCREHFITGSAQGCRGKSAKTQAIELPIRMGNVLCQLTKELCDVDDAVMMPLALAWYEENKKLDECTWPAVMFTKLFVDIVQETVSSLISNSCKKKRATQRLSASSSVS
jgi:Fe-S-cluster containining protein